MIEKKKSTINKVTIFSDIHFGKSKDSSIKIKTAVEFCIWLFKNNNSEALFFLGDWFDNRNSLNVNTHNISFKILQKLASKFKIFLVVGNHDTYFKNTGNVNSIDHFKSIPNIEIISSLTEFDFCGKKVLFCPFHFDWNEIKDLSYDYLIGHFEANGSLQCGSTFNEGHYSINDLLKISPIVFTGHFHINREVEVSNSKYFSVGSPFELDWGDYGTRKGIYNIDLQKNIIEFIQNTFSPIHKKFFWSQIENETEFNEKDIKNNYIKIIVDKNYDYFKVLGICEKMNSLGAINVIPEFTFSLNEHTIEDMKTDKLELKSDILYYIHKFIDKMEFNNTSIDKDELKNLSAQYFQNARNKEEFI